MTSKYRGEILLGASILGLLRMHGDFLSTAAFRIRADNPQHQVRVINLFRAFTFPGN
jgi:hypothetical protein